MFFNAETFKVFKKIAAAFLILALAISGHPTVLLAASFQMPDSLGKVQEIHSGWNGRTLYLIQEAHVDYEAQKAVIGILESLIVQKSVRSILVEGGWGDVSLREMQVYGTPNGRRQIAEKFLRDGKISAEEYLNIIGEYDLQLLGIEDETLYARNMEAFLDFEKEMQNALRDLDQLSSAVEQLESKHYSKKLREFETRRQDYRNASSGLFQYLEFLLHASRTDLKSYPEITRLTDLSGLSGKLNLEKAEKEKLNLIQALTRRVSKIELEPVTSRLNDKGTHEELELLDQIFEIRSRYPEIAKRHEAKHLQAYRQALLSAESMDFEKLHAEIRQLENEIRNQLAKSEQEKTVLGIRSHLDLWKNLLNLQLTPGDEIYLKSLPPLDEINIRKTLGPDFQIELLNKVRLRLPPAEKFYAAAQEREKALALNVRRTMAEVPDTHAAVITGGFHATMLAKQFNEMGFTVVKIAPRFEVTDAKASQEKYFRVMKEKWVGSNSKLQLPNPKQITNPNIQIPSTKQIQKSQQPTLTVSNTRGAS